ncbi:O-antigen ligase family protein [Aquamicrobium lusatiense]|uniref:O-antigen ligase family protein n=1 Tax=Aquamicrobium lusatiense TaxID=89772 RepID=UPI002456CFC2|nr:O-antigen ligase family protein [Aquamicrobium lusatiense]MDH4992804.1 O-antigen ligase family protein [Aquamicrobium lusatiense]
MTIPENPKTDRNRMAAVLARLPQNGIDRNNYISAFLMGALPAVGGSVISVLLYTFFVWAVISLCLGRFSFRMTRSDRVLAWTFTIFVVVIIFTALIGEEPSRAPLSFVWLLAFLSPWAIIPRLRASPSVDYLQPYVTGAATGAIAACVVGLIQLSLLDLRPEAAAGNPAVFGMMSLMLMGLGGLKIGSLSRTAMLFGAVAIGAGFGAVFLSLTRGVLIACIPVLILLVTFAPQSMRYIARHPATLLALVAAAVTLYLVRDMVDLRWQQTALEINLVLQDKYTSSVGERLRLWQAAQEAISQSPIWGYGIQNRMAALTPTLIMDGNLVRGFTHAHNGFLTFALDGGVLALSAVIAVLLVPVYIAWNASRDASYRLRLFAALIVTSSYALCGMTQIMFKHDIMDSFFVFFSMLIAASIPDKSEKATASS